MIYLYVLKSLTFGNRYVGVTENLEKRLREHNSGKCRYTKGRKPWKIIYTEEFSDLGSARKREIFLKSGQGRKFLDSILH
jgi:putative endonuclease